MYIKIFFRSFFHKFSIQFYWCVTGELVYLSINGLTIFMWTNTPEKKKYLQPLYILHFQNVCFLCKSTSIYTPSLLFWRIPFISKIFILSYLFPLLLNSVIKFALFISTNFPHSSHNTVLSIISASCHEIAKILEMLDVLI